MARLLALVVSPSEASSIDAVAATLGCEFDLVLLTGEVEASNASRIFKVGRETLLADAVAAGLVQIAASYSHICGVSSMAAKDILARLAGLLSTPMVSDVTAIESATRFKRLVFAGSIVATVECEQPQIVLTCRASGFAPVSSHAAVAIEPLTLPSSQMTLVSASAKKVGRPDLTQAKVIVSGGKPLRDEATFERIIGGLADSLGGAVGATRAAVDSGIAANEMQVGQTGKVVAPNLYIAAGISGSTQHVAGIKDSKVIVAINSDSSAPIFDVADFGLVADLYEALPELQQKLQDRRNGG